MKNLYDIYEDGTTVTPANTVGMGNPMLPTAEEPGTEPLTPTAKPKKKKKQVKEGILDSMDHVIHNGDKVTEFVNWFVEQACNELSKYAPEKDALLSELYNMVTVDKDTVIIDMAKNTDKTNFDFDILVIYDKPMPSFVKTLKIYNQGKWPVHLNSYMTDLSSFNLEIYADNGKSFGRLSSSFKSKGNDTIKLGNIICDAMLITSKKATSLVLGSESCILELDIQSMPNLTDIYDKKALHHLQKIRATKNYIKHQLCQNGLLPWGIDLYIKDKKATLR